MDLQLAYEKYPEHFKSILEGTSPSPSMEPVSSSARNVRVLPIIPFRSLTPQTAE